MKHLRFLLGAGLALTSAWALAQNAPESLLPGNYDRPSRPAPRATTAPARTPAARPTTPAARPTQAAAAAPVARPSTAPAPAVVSQPVVQATTVTDVPVAPAPALKKIPTLAELEAMSPDQLDELFGLKPKFDIPPAPRRAMTRVGMLDTSEGGLPPGMLAQQSGVLVKAAIAGNRGTMVSRWGHILLRRALASRLAAPSGMTPADFAGLRAALLVRMGEGDAARALVQDVDPANYSPSLTSAALDAYVATADLTGACPMIAIHGSVRKDPQWQVWRTMCSAFQGQGASAMTQLDRQTGGNIMQRIDMLLAQKYAGAAGKARRNVTIEWDGISSMTPWRYALTIATGLKPPASLMADSGEYYDRISATAPMLGLGVRAAAADRAAGRGILSSAAMVDLYSQIHALNDEAGAGAASADLLRSAYIAETPVARLTAMKKLWDDSPAPLQRYSRLVLTAYAAARMPVGDQFSADAPALIASMLSAGLDNNALQWAKVTSSGSLGWGILACANPSEQLQVDGSALNSFYSGDRSAEARKSGFLLAGLAGLNRISPQVRSDFSEKLEVNLDRATRWSRLIDRAAEVNNQELVVLLAGVGMQGEGWDKMTPRHLFHIVSALHRVGLSAEARMIAAEAVARG